MNIQTELPREIFKESGLTYNDVYDNLSLLRDYLSAELENHTNLKMKLSNEVDTSLRFIHGIRNIECFFIKVDGPYFKDREAISFNPDGFIGFCGWADSKNCIPFINGFIKFVNEIKKG